MSFFFPDCQTANVSPLSPPEESKGLMALIGEGTDGDLPGPSVHLTSKLSCNGQGPASSAEACPGPWEAAVSPERMERRTGHFCAHISHLVSLWSNRYLNSQFYTLVEQKIWLLISKELKVPFKTCIQAPDVSFADAQKVALHLGFIIHGNSRRDGRVRHQVGYAGLL